MNRLRVIRRAKDISQHMLAKKAGLQQPTVSLIERYLINPNPETKKKISRAIGCKVVEIFPAEDEK